MDEVGTINFDSDKPRYFVSRAAVHQVYAEWCRSVGRQSMNDANFWSEVQSLVKKPLRVIRPIIEGAKRRYVAMECELQWLDSHSLAHEKDFLLFSKHEHRLK